jgi:hypothetical protein
VQKTTVVPGEAFSVGSLLLSRVSSNSRFAFVALCLLFAVDCLAQFPANDQFSNRIALSGTNIVVTGSNKKATKQTGEPNHAGNVGGASVWWSWTAPTNGDVVITTDGSDFDTLLGIYIGSSVSALSVVASNDDHSVLDTSRVRFQAIGGTEYEIAVDGYNDPTNGLSTGSIQLSLSFIPEPIVRPANDNFTNAIPLTGLSINTTGSNVEATHEPGEPLHAGRMGDTSVWWRWTAPSSEPIMVSTEGSDFDTLLAVYTGSAISNLTLVAANDDQDPTNGILTSLVYFNSIAGQTYQIAVDGFDGDSGLIRLQLAPLAARLSAPQALANGTFQFTLTSAPGKTYEIDATTNLVNWATIGMITNLTGTSVFTDKTPSNPNLRLYRTLLRF